MNFGIFYLVALSLPLLISCYFTTESARSEMEIASQKLLSKYSEIQTNVYEIVKQNKNKNRRHTQNKIRILLLLSIEWNII